MKKSIFIIFLLLSVSLCTSSIADVPIDADHFPDEQFRQMIVHYADISEDGILSEEECHSVKSLYISTPVTSLEGIEYLPDLDWLKCENTLLTELDLTENQRLNELYIFNADNLQKLNISKNPLSSLFLWNCFSLRELSLNPDAPLGIIDLSSCPIESLDLSHYMNLGELHLSYLPIKTLDLSCFTELYSFSYYGTTLSSIDLSHNPKLKNLDIGSESPLEYDLGLLTNLEQLGIRGPLANNSLELSNNPKLYEIYLVDSNITSLDVSQNPNLEILDIMNTNISSLDLSNSPKLKRIGLYNTGISTLDISNCPLLKRWYSRHGKTTSIEDDVGDYQLLVDAETKIITGEE